MLTAIKNFFEQNLSTESQVHDQAHQLRLATAALLLEMMNQDEKILEAEKQAVRDALKETNTKIL